MTDAPTDLQLLRRYAETRADDAFAGLVRRHVDWVYSPARRMVRDPHLAEDVTQAAFILLARKAAKLVNDRAEVAPWLFTATGWTAAAALRSEVRRRRREGQAAAHAAATSGAAELDPW